MVLVLFELNTCSCVISRACFEQRETLKMQSFFFFLSDLVCRPRVPSEDRGNWG